MSGLPWHDDWQKQFPEAWREVPIGCRIADVRLPDGFVIEFQHAEIHMREIRAREADYGPRMAWVWDATKPAADGRLTLQSGGQDPRRRSFVWVDGRQAIRVCRNRMYLDLGQGRLLDVRDAKLADRRHEGWRRRPLQGWGLLMSAAEFLACRDAS
jgi:hypothetical protein